MAVKLRLARRGRKDRPYYHIVAADTRAPRDGKYIEKIGSYNPMLPKDSEQRVAIQEERAKYWISQGAKPTDRVAIFLGKAGIIAMPEQRNNPQKMKPKLKAQERANEKQEKLKAAEDAKKQAEEEAKAAAAEAEAAPAEEASAENTEAEEAEAKVEDAPAVEEAPAEEASSEAAEDEKKAE